MFVRWWWGLHVIIRYPFMNALTLYRHVITWPHTHGGLLSRKGMEGKINHTRRHRRKKIKSLTFRIKRGNVLQKNIYSCVPHPSMYALCLHKKEQQNTQRETPDELSQSSIDWWISPCIPIPRVSYNSNHSVNDGKIFHLISFPISHPFITDSNPSQQ